MKYLLLLLALLVLPFNLSFGQVNIEAMGTAGFGVYIQNGYKPVASAFVGANIPIITRADLETGSRTTYFYTDRLNPELKGVASWLYAKKKFPALKQNWSLTVGMGVIMAGTMVEGGWRPSGMIEVGGGLSYVPITDERDAYNPYLWVNIYP